MSKIGRTKLGHFVAVRTGFVTAALTHPCALAPLQPMRWLGGRLRLGALGRRSRQSFRVWPHSPATITGLRLPVPIVVPVRERVRVPASPQSRYRRW